MANSQPPPSCATCFLWQHKVRGRTCKVSKRVKIDGKKVIGTPPDYLCDKYTPLTHATCGECQFWTKFSRYRKSKPCSDLGLIDGMDNHRSAESISCEHFKDMSDQVQKVQNRTIRVGGVLAQEFALATHSQTTPILVRNGEHEGLLLTWVSEGPGEGSWTVAPVEILDGPHGRFLTQYEDPLDLSKGPEIMFSGSVGFKAAGRDIRVRGQTHPRGTSEMVFRTETGKKFPRNGKVTTLDAPPVKRIEDEPWGDDWEDLVAQMRRVLECNTPPSEAARSVRKSWEESRNIRLSKGGSIRMEAQLKIKCRDV